MISASKQYFISRVSHWRGVLLIDPKIHISVAFKKVIIDSEGESIQEELKHEEMLVSTLERVFLGEERYIRVLELMDVLSGGTWAECDCGDGQYNRFTITAYDCMLRIRGDKFKLFADRCALHECLHVLLWPLMSYVDSIKG